MEYIRISQAAEKWGLSSRRIRQLCSENKIEGAIRKGNLYMIPADSPKPVDGRTWSAKKISPEFFEIFMAINTQKEALDKRRPLTQGELVHLREKFLINFTYNSNAIEGNTLTLKETALVLEGITLDQKPLVDHLEAVGHRDAFLYVQDIVAKKIKITERVVKNIHSLVLINRPEDKGVYRRIPVKIMGAHTEPVQPYLIEPKMTELLLENEKRKKTMHIVERVARFHLEFEGIHPFIDGNGRTGRLLLNLDLMQNGYPPINVKFTERKKYYDAFDELAHKGTVMQMMTLVANYMLEELAMYSGLMQ